MNLVAESGPETRTHTQTGRYFAEVQLLLHFLLPLILFLLLDARLTHALANVPLSFLFLLLRDPPLLFGLVVVVVVVVGVSMLV